MSWVAHNPAPLLQRENYVGESPEYDLNLPVRLKGVQVVIDQQFGLAR